MPPVKGWIDGQPRMILRWVEESAKAWRSERQTRRLGRWAHTGAATDNFDLFLLEARMMKTLKDPMSDTIIK